MGQPPKSKIEQLKREKREAKAAKKRKIATRDKIVYKHYNEVSDENFERSLCKKI